MKRLLLIFSLVSYAQAAAPKLPTVGDYILHTDDGVNWRLVPLPSATPSATPTSTPAPTATATPSASPIPTAQPSPTASPTASPAPTATPTASPTVTPTPPIPPLPSNLTAQFMGVGADVVGKGNSLTADGELDFSIQLRGLRSSPSGVRIKEGTNWWETPWDRTHWNLLVYNGSSTESTLYFAQMPLTAGIFTVTVIYSDGGIETAVSNASGPAPTPGHSATPSPTPAAIAVNISWTPPENQPDIAGYVIRAGKESHQYNRSLGVTETEALVELDSTPPWYFAVSTITSTATEGSITGPLSAEVTYP